VCISFLLAIGDPNQSRGSLHQFYRIICLPHPIPILYPSHCFPPIIQQNQTTATAISFCVSVNFMSGEFSSSKSRSSSLANPKSAEHKLWDRMEMEERAAAAAAAVCAGAA